MSTTLTPEKQALFHAVRMKLGGGVRPIEVRDEAMCSLLDTTMKQYNEQVLSAVIKNNWSNFYGKDANLSASDLAFAFSVRTLDMSKDYSDYASHYVGLQQHGTKWELKKDYFEIEDGKQVYEIPAGREINKVMYITPPTSDPALLATYFGGAYGFGGGIMAQMGGAAAGAFAGTPAGYGIWANPLVMPAYDVALAAADMKTKNQFLAGDLTYTVTAGPDGTHFVHLTNVPGGLFDRMGGFGRRHKCYCWYTYYDVQAGEEDDCRKNNLEVILSPDQVKLDGSNYELLNDVAKGNVLRWFFGEVAETLGMVRGTFSGNINMLASPLTLDYNMFLNWGQKEKEAAKADLKERLDLLSPEKTLEREAQMVDNIIKARKAVPLKIYVR